MKDLTVILDTLGYENIQTYIQSGNIVFKCKNKISENSADEIGKRVLNKKGFEPKVLLISADELQNAVENNPFDTNDGQALHFFFLKSPPPQPNIHQLMSMKAVSEEFKLDKNVFYLYAPDGIGRSKLAAGVEQALGITVTARNWNTISKLFAMVENT